MDPLQGKTVQISQGQWKGYAGVIIGTNEDSVIVELHSLMRAVSVKRNQIAIKERDSWAAGLAGVQPDNWAGGQTPLIGSRTPGGSGSPPPVAFSVSCSSLGAFAAFRCVPLCVQRGAAISAVRARPLTSRAAA